MMESKTNDQEKFQRNNSQEDKMLSFTFSKDKNEYCYRKMTT